MHLSTSPTLPFLTLTLALTTIAHPIIFSPNQPRQLNPVAAAVTPLQNTQVQMLLPQGSGTQRLVITIPERETLGWRAEKWAVAVRWWKGAVRGKIMEGEGADGWNSGGVSAGDWVGDGEEGFRVMEAVEGDEKEEEEMECDVVDEADDDGDEEEDGQIEL